MSDPPAQLLTLLSLLQTPREWPGSELAERLGVSPRTIRRDIERLRDLGYPVQATMGSVGGYRLAAGTAMPPLLLDDTLEWLAFRLVQFGCEFEVHEPPELIEHLRELGDRIRRAVVRD
jgi:predicted DNA-binding transcriptional regulator YafY